MRRLVQFFVIGFFSLPAMAADPLERVLALMDEAATSFQSMTGQIEKVTFTRVLNDQSVEFGTIAVKKSGARAMRLLVRISKPDEKAYAFEGRKIEIYYPKTKLIEEYDLGKHRQVLDEFLLLGFSTPSSELKKSYSISWKGEEIVAGQRAARLELVPRSKNAKEYLSKAEIWISLADGRMVQQKFYESSGDYRQVTYVNAKWNAELPDAQLKLNPPRGVKRVQPQK